MDIEARILRLEQMLKDAGIHEPGCLGGHDCNKSDCGWAHFTPPCSCWLKEKNS
jgi:hypothetical protein